MAKHYKIFKRIKKVKKIQPIIITSACLLILAAGLFLYFHFFYRTVNNYLIENKYYGFKLQTPKGWIGEEKTAYSENNITSLLAECKNDKSDNASVHEIGAFRFQNQKYPDGFGDLGYFPAGLSSGAILEVIVNCIPDSTQSKIGNYSGNLRIAGEQALGEFLNLSGFGKTESLSFLHNNFQYKIREDVYVSPADKNNENRIRENYTEAFKKIISSFNFTR